MPKKLLVAILLVGSLLILAINLFWLGPWIDAKYQGAAANLIYMGVRLAIIFGLPYSLVRWGGTSQAKAVVGGVLVILIDQIVFKGWYLVSLSPQPLTQDEKFNLLAGNALSLIISLPIILLIGMTGAVSANWRSLKRKG